MRPESLQNGDDAGHAGLPQTRMGVASRLTRCTSKPLTRRERIKSARPPAGSTAPRAQTLIGGGMGREIGANIADTLVHCGIQPSD